MDLEELEIQFIQAEASSSVSDHLKFKKLLLSSDNPEVIEYHFDLLKRSQNAHLHDTIARFFKWRRSSGEEYLLSRLKNEEDPHLLAMGIQILGSMHCKKALALARKLIKHPEPTVRERACLSIGWIGNKQDIPRLGKLQCSETDTKTRCWAATQQWHICLRYQGTEREVIGNLLKALENETTDEVIGSIIFTAQEVLKKKFGIKEERSTRRMIGDLDKAKTKAKRGMLKYLSNQS